MSRTLTVEDYGGNVYARCKTVRGARRKQKLIRVATWICCSECRDGDLCAACEAEEHERIKVTDPDPFPWGDYPTDNYVLPLSSTEFTVYQKGGEASNLDESVALNKEDEEALDALGPDLVRRIVSGTYRRPATPADRDRCAAIVGEPMCNHGLPTRTCGYCKGTE